ncbi:MAG TPA: hypothetical protein VJK05_02970 [archaeon]|nr:hypothetical protein [archaeon]
MILENELKVIKKSCNMCKTYESFQPDKSESNKAEVQKKLKILVKFFNQKYDWFRSLDKSEEEIMQCKKNKMFVYELQDACNSCPKDFERASRKLSEHDFNNELFNERE